MTTTYAWHPSVPNGCRSCGTRDHPHAGRGCCAACYQWLERRGRLGEYPLLPVHGNRGTDSWARSPRNLTVYRNHKRRRAAAWERQRRIWFTDGVFIRHIVPTFDGGGPPTFRARDLRSVA